MSPSRVSRLIVLDRLSWVDRMVVQVRALPLSSFSTFMADLRNPGAAESCLRRVLEALFDAGRHILAKGFATGEVEYRAIAEGLERAGVLAAEDAALLRVLAGYRNRLVDFYHEVSTQELYDICSGQLGDLERIRDGLTSWMAAHPEMIDTAL